MASIIRIKRSSVSGNPATLGAGELAYSALTDNGSNGGDRLYIGIGSETAGNAANHFVIGGKYFTDMLDHTPGTLTASSALIADASSKLNNLKVDNLDLDGNTISSTDTNGNIVLTPNGTGKLVLNNPYINGTTDTLAEFIYDTVGGAVTGTASQILVTNNDGGNTSTISLINTAVTAGSYGSATAIPTFTVDAQGRLTAASTVSITTSLGIAGDTGSDTIALATDTITFTGGTGLTSTVNSGTNTVTFDIDSTVATLTGTQTLTNKTLTLPTIGGTGAAFSGSTSGTTTVVATAAAGTTTLTLPAATDTLVGKATTDTLTNKTISGSSNTLSNIANASLTNSSVTINGTSVSLGASATVTAAAGTLTGATLNSGVTASSLTSVGTIATGVWEATDIGVAHGGTGTSTGSITGTAALTFTAGGSNTNVNLVPNGTGTVDVSSKRITSLADPTGAQDAATKAYVDAVQTGLDLKASVRAATTANITLSNTQTVDGVALSVGDRVLVKNQSTGSQNGIYVVASGSWTRSTDCDNTPGTEVTSGLFTFVEEGTTNADSGWVLTTDSTITVGTTALTFVQFSGAGQITAGAALTKTGNTLDVAVDDSTIEVNSDALRIKSTYVGQTSITTLGTIATGTWQGSVVAGQYGGTGVANTGKTITIGGNFTHTGAHTLGLTTTANTSVTLPTTGTLATLAGSETFTNKTLTTPTINGGTHTAITSLGIRDTSAAYDVTIAAVSSVTLTAGRTLTLDLENAARTISLGGNIDIAGNLTTAAAFTTSGANALTLTTTASTNVTLPTTGTLATLAGSETFTNKTLTSPTVTGGTINNTVIGGSTAAAGSFTTINASSTITAQGNITGAGAATSTLDGFNIDGGTY
jgi:hypothetical protein